MPTQDWLRREFHYGYDSGNVLSIIPNLARFKEELKIGGSYRNIFFKAILPYLKPDSVVLEIGPGRGSWTKAILKYIPSGRLCAVDFQDAKKWLKPEKYSGRLLCYKINDFSDYSFLEDNFFDFCWSFGVLCHHNLEHIEEILKVTLSKMKQGGIAVHQYADWDKLERFGWKRGDTPLEFKEKADNEIWWPRNNQRSMASLAEKAGWQIISVDLDLVKRDAIIVLKR
jgi:SAM-dependent methyltransferase